MYQLIKDFPQQMRHAIELGENISIKTTFSVPIQNIVVSGMGGSGIGGDLLSELMEVEIKVPIICNKGYTLPSFVGANSLVILSSYSGNTEETLSVGHQALTRGIKPICITSGGALAEMAKESGWDLVIIPSGRPPRASLGYSAIQLFYVLYKLNLIDISFKAKLIASADLMENTQPEVMQQAESITQKLQSKIIITFSEDKLSSVALRFKQQVNENSKAHLWVNALPEMNHNELVAWCERNEDLAVVYLVTKDMNTRVRERMAFNRPVIEKVTPHVFEIEAKGEDTYQEHFYLIHLTDWISYYLGVVKGYDPMEIDVLIALKNHMSSIK
jgi:glucose/mannose-6-phosphate isomerase